MMATTSWQIKKTKVRMLHASLIQPFRTAQGDHDQLENLLFILTLTDGTQGYGEAAIATHITGETVTDSKRHLQEAGRWLVGKDIRDYLTISAQCHECWSRNPAAIAAVEMAILDALTHQLGIPLWKLFGSRPQRLKTDITIVIADLPETEAAVQRFYAQGFRQFKVKIGRDHDLDLRRLMIIRDRAPQGTIYLDSNGGFSADETLKLLRQLKRQGIRPQLLEQPVPRHDWEGLKKVSRLTDIPVCADESVRSIPEAVMVIKGKAADVINIKLMKFGFIQAREIALLAQTHGVGLMIGGMMESSLAMTASAHLAAGMGCFSYIDLDTPFFIREEGVRNPYLSSKGVYDLRRVRKGIGIAP